MSSPPASRRCRRGIQLDSGASRRGAFESDPDNVAVGPGPSLRAATKRSQSRAAYETLSAEWKNADPEIPILRQAKAGYAKLE
jgi:hypothetical protein